MTIDVSIELCRQAIWLALTLCGPVLLVALAVGLMIGVLQAATQLQDSSLLFVPRLLILSLLVAYLLPWGLSLLTDYAADLIRGIPGTL